MTALLNALLAIPKMIETLKSLVTWLSGAISDYEMKNASQNMQKAITQAETTKDTSKMDNLFIGKDT